jgi:Tir chaperone protein (CesT) family
MTDMANDPAQAVLEAFGRQVGIDLAFEDGHCALAIDKIVINIEHDRPRDRLLIYSLIGTPGGDLAVAYGAILQANYLGVGTKGPSFLPASVELPVFEATLQNFVEVTEQWTMRLPELGVAEPASSPSPAGSLRA